jgi:hypothetical protein
MEEVLMKKYLMVIEICLLMATTAFAGPFFGFSNLDVSSTAAVQSGHFGNGFSYSTATNQSTAGFCLGPGCGPVGMGATTYANTTGFTGGFAFGGGFTAGMQDGFAFSRFVW